MNNRFTVSQTRFDEDKFWVLDVMKDDIVVQTLPVDEVILPPRVKNKKVIWALPSDPQTQPKLMAIDVIRVLDFYKTLRKQQKKLSRTTCDTPHTNIEETVLEEQRNLVRSGALPMKPLPQPPGLQKPPPGLTISSTNSYCACEICSSRNFFVVCTNDPQTLASLVLSTYYSNILNKTEMQLERYYANSATFTICCKEVQLQAPIRSQLATISGNIFEIEGFFAKPLNSDQIAIHINGKFSKTDHPPTTTQAHFTHVLVMNKFAITCVKHREREQGKSESAFQIFFETLTLIP